METACSATITVRFSGTELAALREHCARLGVGTSTFCKRLIVPAVVGRDPQDRRGRPAKAKVHDT